MAKYTLKFKVPKHLEVPAGAVIPSPKTENEGMITGNWRTYRPVIDHEKCTTCMNCYIFCPDACWQLDEKTEKWSGTPNTARAASSVSTSALRSA